MYTSYHKLSFYRFWMLFYLSTTENVLHCSILLQAKSSKEWKMSSSSRELDVHLDKINNSCYPLTKKNGEEKNAPSFS